MKTLRQALDDYLTLRQAMGFKLSEARTLLPRFVDFLESLKSFIKRQQINGRHGGGDVDLFDRLPVEVQILGDGVTHLGAAGLKASLAKLSSLAGGKVDDIFEALSIAMQPDITHVVDFFIMSK